MVFDLYYLDLHTINFKFIFIFMTLDEFKEYIQTEQLAESDYNNCIKYFESCNSAKKEETIESGDIQRIVNNANRWVSLQGVERRPRRKKAFSYADLKNHINGANVAELYNVISELQSLIELAEKRIEYNKDAEANKLLQQLKDMGYNVEIK